MGVSQPVGQGFFSYFQMGGKLWTKNNISWYLVYMKIKFVSIKFDWNPAAYIWFHIVCQCFHATWWSWVISTETSGLKILWPFTWRCAASARDQGNSVLPCALGKPRGWQPLRTAIQLLPRLSDYQLLRDGKLFYTRPSVSVRSTRLPQAHITSEHPLTSSVGQKRS